MEKARGGAGQEAPALGPVGGGLIPILASVREVASGKSLSPFEPSVHALAFSLLWKNRHNITFIVATM